MRGERAWAGNGGALTNVKSTGISRGGPTRGAHISAGRGSRPAPSPGLPQGPAPTHSRSTPAFRASRAAYFAHDIWGLLGVRGKSRAGSYPSKPGASLKTLLRPEQRKEKSQTAMPAAGLGPVARVFHPVPHRAVPQSCFLRLRARSSLPACTAAGVLRLGCFVLL